MKQCGVSFNADLFAVRHNQSRLWCNQAYWQENKNISFISKKLDSIQIHNCFTANYFTNPKGDLSNNQSLQHIFLAKIPNISTKSDELAVNTYF